MSPILELAGLTVQFRTDEGVVHAVESLDFSIEPGETVGIVGESGSGKSVSMLATMGLLPRGASVRGSAKFDGTELVGNPTASRMLRGGRLAMIFQDPLTALNPVMRIGTQIAEAIRAHRSVSARDAQREAVDLLERVGIPEPAARARQYPHEFSGGMRQRVMIAMAIANRPDVLIADEPTTALDVTVQAQIIDVLRDVQSETGSALAFITHDLGVVASIADRVQVMYAGRAVEGGTVEQVLTDPRHPYTHGLLRSTPMIDLSRPNARLQPIVGSPPSLLDPPSGCAFHPRCPHAQRPCVTDVPEHRMLGRTRWAACHYVDTIDVDSPAAEVGRR
jgi:oligopeptide/dipeptide ABC transporter ATP-binding protein